MPAIAAPLTSAAPVAARPGDEVELASVLPVSLVIAVGVVLPIVRVSRRQS